MFAKNVCYCTQRNCYRHNFAHVNRRFFKQIITSAKVPRIEFCTVQFITYSLRWVYNVYRFQFSWNTLAIRFLLQLLSIINPFQNVRIFRIFHNLKYHHPYIWNLCALLIHRIWRKYFENLFSEKCIRSTFNFLWIQ